MGRSHLKIIKIPQKGVEYKGGCILTFYFVGSGVIFVG